MEYKDILLIVFVTFVLIFEELRIGRVKKESNNFNLLCETLNLWLMLKNQNESLCKYFDSHNYKTVAIYGMGNLGDRLQEELETGDIKVVYGIDNNVKQVASHLHVINIEEISEMEKVDVIVVTEINYFKDIKIDIESRTDITVLSLKKLVDNAVWGEYSWK